MTRYRKCMKLDAFLSIVLVMKQRQNWLNFGKNSGPNQHDLSANYHTGVANQTQNGGAKSRNATLDGKITRSSSWGGR